MGNPFCGSITGQPESPAAAAGAADPGARQGSRI